MYLLARKKKDIFKIIDNIVEYKDTYNPETKKITITDVLYNGNTMHIYCILNFIEEIKDLIYDFKIDVDLLEALALLHDIGKIQPILKVGDVVDTSIFEIGEKHAYRGESLCEQYTNNECVKKLVKYHHSKEDLWEDFNEYEKIHLRLFKLLDGLSAATTRKDSSIELSYTGNGEIIVIEHSHDNRYNGKFKMDFFKSEEKKMDITNAI